MLPEPALERFLANQDILGTIFEEFLPNSSAFAEIVPQRKRLLACALTCQAFTQSALDILWSYLDRVSPLLRLLPHESRGDGSPTVLITPISEAQWARFEYYGRRVRIFAGFSKSEAHWTEVTLYLSSLKRSSILPGVTRLLVPQTMPEPHFHHLISIINLQSLKHVEITANKPVYNQFIKDMLPTLATSGHFVEVLEISGYIEGQSLVELSGFQKLRSLKFLARVVNLIMEDDLVTPLSKLPTLRHLSLDLALALSVWTPNRPPERGSYFRNLKTLHLATTSTAIIFFLSSIDSRRTSLIQLCLRLNQQDVVAGALGPIFQAVLPLRSLQTIGIESDASWKKNVLQSIILDPFNQLPDLRIIYLNGFKLVSDSSPDGTFSNERGLFSFDVQLDVRLKFP